MPATPLDRRIALIVVDPQPQDQLVTKRTWGAFIGTALEQRRIFPRPGETREAREIIDLLERSA